MSNDDGSDARPGAKTRFDGADRRLFPRHATRLEVDYSAEDTFLFAYVTDISDMGIFVRTEEPSQPGTRLTLRFTIPDAPRATSATAAEDSTHNLDSGPDAKNTRRGDESEVFEVAGEVRWMSDGSDGGHSGMGVQFIDIESDARKRIMALVRAVAYLDADSS